MKRGVSLIFFVFILLIPLVFAANIEVRKVDKGSVIISELDNPAVFDLVINNKGSSDIYEVYSLVGVSMSPKGNFDLPSGISTVEVKAYLPREVREREGLYTFEYYLRGQNSGITKETLTVKIIYLKNAIEIFSDSINPSDSEASIIIRNTQNTHLENLNIRVNSVFYDIERSVTLGPYENSTIKAEINKENTKKLKAGPYVVNAEVEFEDAKVEFDGIVKYLEKEGVSVSKSTEGVIVRGTTITKTNEGNVAVLAKIETSKDILSRLFTVFSSEPSMIERKGLSVNYIWEKELQPAESLVITTTTNYTFPFILLVLVVIIALLAKIYSQKAIVVDKRVSFVKTKGGQFALKVRLHIKARNHADNVQLIDSLPGVMRLYDKFGRSPDRVDEATKRIFWNIGNLNSGEERVFSYIIYTDVNIIGRFELPSATAVFEKDGRTHEVLSNRTFFVSETAKSIET